MGCTAAGRPGRPAGAARCHGDGGGRQPRPGGRGSRWRDGAPAGGGAGRGPRGPRLEGRAPGFSSSSLLPGSRGSLGDSCSASGLQARAPVLASAATPCASALSLVASVSPTVEGGVGPGGFHARFSAHFLWLWDRPGRIQGWVISHPLLRWRHVLIK